MKMQYTVNYYNILKLEHSATTDDIKKSYRSLAQIHHPDKGGDEEMFKNISEAYKILTNPTLKDKYDTESMFGSKYDSSLELYNFEFNQNHEYDELNKNLTKYKDNELVDILLKVNISTFNGKLLYDRKIKCEKCIGTGKDIYAKTICYGCKGSGIKHDNVCNICDGNGDISSFDECDYCNATGEMRGTICPFCKGLKNIYTTSCMDCHGSGHIKIKQNITVNIEEFIDNKLLVKNMGNVSVLDPNKIGSLYIILEEKN